jgi:hypothetical protein
MVCGTLPPGGPRISSLGVTNLQMFFLLQFCITFFCILYCHLNNRFAAYVLPSIPLQFLKPTVYISCTSLFTGTCFILLCMLLNTPCSYFYIILPESPSVQTPCWILYTYQSLFPIIPCFLSPISPFCSP